MVFLSRNTGGDLNYLAILEKSFTLFCFALFSFLESSILYRAFCYFPHRDLTLQALGLELAVMIPSCPNCLFFVSLFLLFLYLITFELLLKQLTSFAKVSHAPKHTNNARSDLA